ncbi:hypothetical protein EV127DRAFT_340291 [Xylaria flabelliformis]|nr:hypothetical protein EV127DRAFT_340291 [Xylaria flabelliformis]
MSVLGNSGDDNALIKGEGASNPEGQGKLIVKSSKAKRAKDDIEKVLETGSEIDNFVSLLAGLILTFSSVPTGPGEAIEFDSVDPFAIWIKFLDSKSTFSATFDDPSTLNITSFDFQMTEPWKLKFSSSASALIFSFGEGRIPTPGLMPDGKLLYLGLDPTSSTDISCKLRDVFDFTHTSRPLFTIMKDWGVTLLLKEAKGKRNALWFCPVNYNQSILKLQFSLHPESVTQFQGYIQEVLPGFNLDAVHFIGKKVLTSGRRNGVIVATPTGEISIHADGHITLKGGDYFKITAGITFFSDRYDLTVRFDSDKGGGPGSILSWLATQAGIENLDIVQQLLGTENNKLFGDNFYLRQIKMGLGASPEGKITRIRSFSLDIEAKATFGKASGGDPVVFLLNYSWRKGGPKLGTIRGTSDNLGIADLAPSYEVMDHLKPVTPKFAKTISIPSMLPGVTIDTVPGNVPTEISSAYIELSSQSIRVGGSIRSQPLKGALVGNSSIPQLNLGLITLDASYNWKTKKATVMANILVELQGSPHSKHKETAMLVGSLKYDSGDWILGASLRGLHLSTLYEFFGGDADHVIPLIEAIEIEKMDLTYKYLKDPQGGAGNQAAGSYFIFDGRLNVAGLQLTLKFEHQKNSWTFKASLAPEEGKPTSIANVLRGLLGDDIDIPDFLEDANLSPKNDKIELEVVKGKSGALGGKAAFQFIATLQIKPFETTIALTFAQWHGEDWKPALPSKRLLKVALTGLPSVNIPLVGDITQPFDEMHFMWVQDNTQQIAGKQAGITRKEMEDLNITDAFKDHKLVVKDKNKSPSPDVVVINAGAHFVIVIKNGQGVSTCLLDYDFKKQETKVSRAMKLTEKTDSDGGSSNAPYKKKLGPLSVNNIGLKYSGKVLGISLNATMEIGPMGFTLIGFSLNFNIASLDLKKVQILPPSLEGFAVAFERKPLTIAGIVRHGKSDDLEYYYAGGLIVGFIPYQLEAAGFYGQAKAASGNFVSVFVFARLQGPLVTLEFAEISGVTGGFGYNSQVRIPTVDQIPTFPFVDQNSVESAQTALEALEKLTSPSGHGWFKPQNDMFWAAAGMKVDAFQMISLDAVVVIQFGNSVRLDIIGVALVDIPNSRSSLKFAHVELGIAVHLDFDLGLLAAEAQLSPKSFILHPSCKLTGGFALYYWFDAPHADRSNIGNFVFTIGGYHQAFRVPVGWPNPERLRISWSLGSSLSISGEGFFAITSKACMGGGRLRASFSAGPIAAWFDVFANFLIQYQPFYFSAGAGICVGASFSLDIWFIHIYISVEVDAYLTLWGPPLAGVVSVDIKVAKFDIGFGDSKKQDKPLKLEEFYELVLQASSKNGLRAKQKAARAAIERSEAVVEAEEKLATTRTDEGHTFLAESGLMNDSINPNRDENELWVVRAGAFAFVVGCKVVIDKATLENEEGKELNSVQSDAGKIYAKPMKIDKPLASHLKVTITKRLPSNFKEDAAQREGADTWDMHQEYKFVPKGLWGEYPKGGNNNIKQLLNGDDGGIRLMAGVLFRAPPPVMSTDKLEVFDIIDSMLTRINSDRGLPFIEHCHSDWAPAPPDDHQYEKVRGAWEKPLWDRNQDEDEQKPVVGAQAEEAEGVQTEFVSSWIDTFKWDKGLSAFAKMPKLLHKRFNELYVAAPLMTK